jgi:hypothetical protein
MGSLQGRGITEGNRASFWQAVIVGPGVANGSKPIRVRGGVGWDD